MAKKKPTKRKRANGDGSIYQRKSDGAWVAAMSRGIVNGKRERTIVVTKTRDEARDELTAMMGGSSRPSATEPLSEFLLRWLKQEVKPNCEKSTYHSYEDECRKRIIPQIGGTRLNRLKPAHVQSMIATLREQSVGARTLENCYTVLSTACEYGKRMGMLTINPCGAVTKPKRKPKEIFPFLKTEASEILKTVTGDPLEGVYVLALTIGLRQGEIFGLRWKCLDLDAGELTVNWQAAEIRGRLVLKKPKSKASNRTVKLSDMAIAVLAERRAIAMKEGNAASEYVFCGAKGAVIRRSNFGKRFWTPLLKRLKLKHRGFHHARHTAATLMLSNGVPLHVVSKILGHSRPSITLDLYSHFMPDDADSASNVVASLLAQ